MTEAKESEASDRRSLAAFAPEENGTTRERMMQPKGAVPTREGGTGPRSVGAGQISGSPTALAKGGEVVKMSAAAASEEGDKLSSDRDDDGAGDREYRPRWGSTQALEVEGKSPDAEEKSSLDRDTGDGADNGQYMPRWGRSSAEAKEEVSSDRDSDTNDREYKPRWGSSSMATAAADDQLDDDDGDDDEYVPFIDDLPVFADESNKALHRETKRLEKLREEAEKGAKEHSDRVAIMAEHLQNVRQEIDHTNGLVAAIKKEVETEEHLAALAERESGLCRSEIKKAEDSVRDQRGWYKTLQAQIFKANDDMEKLKLALNWNQEELEQWAMAATKKEEDNLTLQKYTRSDEVKIKELTLAIESLAKVAVEKQAQLDNEATETQSRQMELDRTAESFKVQHAERRQLVKQWQETIQAMRTRDDEINEISTKYAEAKREVHDQMRLLSKNREVLALLEGDIDELSQEVETAGRLVQAKRQEHLSQQQAQQDLKSELDVLQHESTASAAALQNLVSEHRGVENELASKWSQLESFQKRCNDIKKRLEDEKQETVTKERATIQVEKFLEEREKELRQVDAHLESLKGQMYRDSQQLADLRKDEADLISEIRNAQANSKNLSANLRDLEMKRSRQQEIIYNSEFQLQQMERKVARGLGERSDEEKQQLQSRIVFLEKELETHVGKRKSLLQQCKKVQLELQSWKRRKDDAAKQCQDIQRQISDVELEIASCELGLKQTISSKEEAMVSHDVIRLEVRRLRDLLRNRLQEVCSLENQRWQLDLSMAEKKEEMKIHAEVRTAQVRAAEEERHKNAVELGQRNVVLEKLRSKYEMISKAHRSDDDDGEERSQVYYLIMAAQKREELQREGDKLDASIRKKEKEIRAMEKTLAHLRERNTKFRLSFHKADMDSSAAKELKAWDEKVRISQQKLFEQKKELRHLESESEENELKLQRISQQKAQLEAENEHMEVAKEQVKDEVETHKKSVETSETQLQGLIVEHQGTFPPISEELKSVQGQLFRAELIEKQSSTILRMLSELGQEFPELQKGIMRDLTSEGIRA